MSDTSPVIELNQKYDIAISFLSQDEKLANDLEAKLSPMFSVFVYSKKQDEIAGTDGLESLQRPFRYESKLAVVLFRAGWGQTKWTRVEETAIKEMVLSEGWEHLLFVSLSSEDPPPKWLPQFDIRLNLDQYPFDQCVTAIRASVERLGAKARIESPVEHAKRVERETLWQRNREALLSSSEGVGAAFREAQSVFDCLENIVTEIKSTLTEIHIDLARDKSGGDTGMIVKSPRCSMTVYWIGGHGHEVENCSLRVGLWKGPLRFPGETGFYVTRPSEYEVHMFESDITREIGWCWHISPNQYFTSKQMAEHCASLFLDAIGKAK